MPVSKITIYTDGASRGNPGQAGAGVSVSGLESETELSVYLGQKTNNEAEYIAFLLAVKLLLRLQANKPQNSRLNNCQLVFKLDSMLVVNQLNKDWKIKEKRMQKLADKIQELLKKLDLPYQIKHIDRDNNQRADWLANQAIDLANC